MSKVVNMYFLLHFLILEYFCDVTMLIAVNFDKDFYKSAVIFIFK